MGTVRLGLDPSKSTPCKSIFFIISSQNLFNHCSNSSFSFSGVVSFQRGASFRIVTSSYNCWASLHCFSIVSFQYAFTRCYIKLHLLGFLHSKIFISFIGPIFSSFVDVKHVLVRNRTKIFQGAQPMNHRGLSIKLLSSK